MPSLLSQQPARSRDEKDFQYIIDLVYQRSRIRLHDGKKPLIMARLGKRIRHHKMDSLGEYCRFLQTSGEEEITHAIDALTTNFTQFLREEKHFKFLIETALPELLKGGRKKFHLWSAACATGEEPYSMALYLAHYFPLEQGWDWRITATDISTKALATAKEGIYPEERLRQVPTEWVRKNFQKGQKSFEGLCRVKKGLRERIHFSQVNLLGDYHFKEQYEVIFCRNVMIYFDRSTQVQLVRRLSNFLAPKGYLVVGHSESLTGLNIPFQTVKPSIYQKP
ncbi:MAG: protein-glutamate O-methyltransferase CheR [Verrucomicrobiota bacterium]|nr:protein-glutamate O-methyltransferase CheR [Verrucomicrobiota bacterium]